MDSSSQTRAFTRRDYPQKLYLTRRQFLKAAGVVSASAFLAACLGTPEDASPTDPALADVQTKRELAENFNNYYEFSLSKTSVAEAAKDFNMQPWQVEVDGLVRNPKKYTIEEIVSLFPQEERVYRMRCVEGWSMVLPGRVFRLPDCWKTLNRCRKRNTSGSCPSSARRKCPDKPACRSPGPTWKGCGWTKPATT